MERNGKRGRVQCVVEDEDEDEEDVLGYSEVAGCVKRVKLATPPCSQPIRPIAPARPALNTPLTQPRRKRATSTTAGSVTARRQQTSLWVDSHRPECEADLAVHPTRVAEVKRWLSAAIAAASSAPGSSGRAATPNVLVLTGPPGAGKTAMVRVLAESLGCELAEFSDDGSTEGAPRHVAFAEWLRSTSRSASVVAERPRILLLEDLPFVTKGRAAECFGTAIQEFTRSPGAPPLVIVSSDPSASCTAETPSLRVIRELSGATRIKVNPVAPKRLEKLLLAAAAKEGSPVSKEDIRRIASEVAGDIRCALNSLQFASTETSRAPAVRSDMQQPRDLSPTLFHAAARALYAKRKPDGSFERTPESIAESCTYARPWRIVEFVQENYLTFFTRVAECAEASEVASLCDSWCRGSWRKREDSHQQITAVTTLRGFMCANCSGLGSSAHQGRGTFQSLTKPQTGEVERAVRSNEDVLAGLPCVVCPPGLPESKHLPLWLLCGDATRLDVLPYASLLPDSFALDVTSRMTFYSRLAEGDLRRPGRLLSDSGVGLDEDFDD